MVKHASVGGQPCNFEQNKLMEVRKSFQVVDGTERRKRQQVATEELCRVESRN